MSSGLCCLGVHAAGVFTLRCFPVDDVNILDYDCLSFMGLCASFTTLRNIYIALAGSLLYVRVGGPDENFAHFQWTCSNFRHH